MHKICVVTAARSEYGLLRWTIDEIHRDAALDLQLVVTGAHLSSEYGDTYKCIEDDGYTIAERVDMQLCTSDKEEIVRSMGRCMIGFADVFAKLSPGLVVVLGDRYELLPICNAALVMNIPIAHISGGDVTLGAIDNEIRNAITMMSSLHFPGVEDSALNIRRMRNCSDNIYTVGEPGLDNFHRLDLWDRERLAHDLCLDTATDWVLLSLHPETQQDLAYNLDMAHNVISVLNDIEGISVVITKANADFGGEQINSYFETVASENVVKYRLFSSLGQVRYLSFIKECRCLVGNSSSGIVEAPYAGIPVINIGNRQKGRHQCPNVVQSDCFKKDIMSAWLKVSCMHKGDELTDHYWGDGYTAERIVGCIKRFMDEANGQ